MPHYTASEKSAQIEVTEANIKFDGTKTVLLVGVGGQGTILAGSLPDSTSRSPRFTA